MRISRFRANASLRAVFATIRERLLFMDDFNVRWLDKGVSQIVRQPFN